MKRWIIVVLLAVAAAAGEVWWLRYSSASDLKPSDDSIVVQGGKERFETRIKERRLRTKKRGVESHVSEADTCLLYNFSIDDDDEAKLNDRQRKQISDIRSALDNNDKRRVLALVHEIQASDEWPDGVPKSVKKAAMDALAWFGAAGIVELADFIGDKDAEISQAAIEKYEEALSDIDLSDRERSLILVHAAKFVNDAEAMDTMMFELNNMRHSVGVETIKQIWENGTPAAKSVLQDNVDFFTGEENINTPEMLDKWLAEHPDDPDADDFYGGSSRDD